MIEVVCVCLFVADGCVGVCFVADAACWFMSVCCLCGCKLLMAYVGECLFVADGPVVVWVW